MHKTETERIQALEDAIKNLATKEEIEKIVRDTISDIFLNAGKGAKAVIITLAIVIGSLGVITGGFKAVLAFIGFQYIK